MNSKIQCITKINSNREYHADVDIYSSTMLKKAIDSPATFIQGLLERYITKRSTDFGSLMHALVLEPETVNDLVAIYPDEFTRAKESTLFKEVNKGRFCLTLREFVQAQNLADKVLNQKFRGRPFHQFVAEGVAEESYYFTDPTTGLSCRTRLDLRHPETTFDLKTTRYSEPDSFAKQAVDLHYDLSAYMYALSRLLYEIAHPEEYSSPTLKPFVLVSICTEAPHSVFFRPVSSTFMENGKKKYENALAIIKACSQVQAWPAMGGEIELDIAPWQSFTPNSSANLCASI
ncbi:PD-(D/E)XK nuclease-like domain-containing protein [Comamonas sp. w2-DMI]|uniref:PD-(D/E)XK nuclease-like domain-containing protein n=1 Tax=Comamonas sp. w2-DMI TaxID=3126391 RepID=UPI0032E4CC50